MESRCMTFCVDQSIPWVLCKGPNTLIFNWFGGEGGLGFLCFVWWLVWCWLVVLFVCFARCFLFGLGRLCEVYCLSWVFVGCACLFGWVGVCIEFSFLLVISAYMTFLEHTCILNSVWHIHFLNTSPPYFLLKWHSQFKVSENHSTIICLYFKMVNYLIPSQYQYKYFFLIT